MLKFLKRFFVPSRFDALCFAVAVHWMVAVFSVAILPSIPRGRSFANADPIIMTAGATWVAIAATLCWRANSARRTWLLAISSIASVCFVVGWYYLNVDVVEAKSILSPGRLASQTASFDLSRFLANAKANVAYAVLIAVFVWLISITSRKVFRVARKPLAGLGWRFRGDRTKVLISVAAVMFVLAIVSRVLSSGGPSAIFRLHGPTVEFVFAMIGYALLWFVVLFWFPRSFVLPGKPIQKICTFLLVLLVMLPVIADASNAGSFNDKTAVFLSGILFVLSVIAVGGRPLKKQESSQQPEKFFESRPSCFAVVPVALLAVALGIQTFFDVGVLASASGNSTLTELIEKARESAIVKWESGGRIQFLSNSSVGGSVWRVQFDESAPRDIVNIVQDRTGSRFIELCDMTPDFDTSMLNGSAMGILLSDCEVSNSQLTDILSSSSWMTIRGKFSVVDDGTKVDPGVVNSVQFENVKPGVVQRFFDAAKCEDQMIYTIVHSPIGNEDWPAIEEVAKGGMVYLYGGWAENFKLPSESRSLKRVHFHDLTDPGGRPKPVDRDLILNTDMQLNLTGPGLNSPWLAWKLMLLRGDSGGYPLTHYLESSGKPLDEFANKLGLSYRLNDDQTIHSIYLPRCSGIDLQGLDDVRVLSFDPGWVQGESTAFGGGDPISLSPFKTLTSLEELYFEPSFVPEDLSILADLTSLKHLQIPSVVRKVTGRVGFDACQTLESITFFGKPDNTTYREISRLRNLKRLVIVNSENDETLTDEYLAKLQKKFLGVDARIILPSETEPLVPEPFRKYRDRVRKELRADTSWLDELTQ